MKRIQWIIKYGTYITIFRTVCFIKWPFSFFTKIYRTKINFFIMFNNRKYKFDLYCHVFNFIEKKIIVILTEILASVY